jgi:hypothetical protein
MRQTIPQRLYTASDLIEGFNPFDDLGFTLTRDFAAFRQFAADGGPMPPSLEVRTAQADRERRLATRGARSKPSASNWTTRYPRF